MNILVTENTKKHFTDAYIYSKNLKNCVVNFATTLTDARNLLRKNQYDGVISDVLFPIDNSVSTKIFENAILIGIELIKMGIHYVFNTSKNYYGKEFQNFIQKAPKPIHSNNNYHFLTVGMLIETYPNSNRKQWQAAFRYILLTYNLLKLPDKGNDIIQNAKLQGFPYGEYGKLTEYFERCHHPFIIKTFKSYNA